VAQHQPLDQDTRYFECEFCLQLFPISLFHNWDWFFSFGKLQMTSETLKPKGLSCLYDYVCYLIKNWATSESRLDNNVFLSLSKWNVALARHGWHMLIDTKDSEEFIFAFQ
jgi:hypothetical protein